MNRLTIDPEAPTSIKLGPAPGPEQHVAFSRPILADDGDTLVTLHGVEIARTSLLVSGPQLRLGRSVKLHFDLLGQPIYIIAVVQWSMAGGDFSISRLRFGVTSRDGNALLSQLLGQTPDLSAVELAETAPLQVGPGDGDAGPDEDEVTAVWRRTPTGLHRVRAPDPSGESEPAPSGREVNRRSGGTGLVRAFARPRRPSRRACFGAPGPRRPGVFPNARR